MQRILIALSLQYMEMQQKGMLKLGEEEEEYEVECKEQFVGAEGLEEEQLREKSIHYMLLEFQRINQELYDELEKVKEDYDIATGIELKGSHWDLRTHSPVETSQGLRALLQGCPFQVL